MSFRKDFAPASKITARPSLSSCWYSFHSMLQNPYTAFTGVPSARVSSRIA